MPTSMAALPASFFFLAGLASAAGAEAAFEAFCRDNRAQRLSDEQAAQVDVEAQRWRQGQADPGDA